MFYLHVLEALPVRSDIFLGPTGGAGVEFMHVAALYEGREGAL